MDGTLRNAAPGSLAVVVAVTAQDKDRKRLESMGIIPGVEVSVLANNGGQILAAVGQGRIMLEREVAGAVIVV